MRNYQNEAAAVCKMLGGVNWFTNVLNQLPHLDTVDIVFDNPKGIFRYSVNDNTWKDLVKKATEVKMTDEEMDELCIQCSVLVGDIQEYKDTIDRLDTEIVKLGYSRTLQAIRLGQAEEELESLRNKLRGN